MAMDDDTLLQQRVRPRSTLLELKPPAAPVAEAAAKAPPDIPAIDDLVPLPQPGDPYKAYARPDNKALLMLRFLLRDGVVEGFCYADLRHTRMQPGDDPGGGPVLVLRFVEAVMTEVRIEGRHLDTLADLVAYHRIAWLRELPPGKMHHEKNAAVITKITITVLEG